VHEADFTFTATWRPLSGQRKQLATRSLFHSAFALEAMTGAASGVVLDVFKV